MLCRWWTIKFCHAFLWQLLLLLLLLLLLFLQVMNCKILSRISMTVVVVLISTDGGLLRFCRAFLPKNMTRSCWRRLLTIVYRESERTGDYRADGVETTSLRSGYQSPSCICLVGRGGDFPPFAPSGKCYFASGATIKLHLTWIW